MTCDEARDLLLDRPSGDPDLRAHVGGCVDCAAAQEEMGRIDAWVAPLRESPVPRALLERRAARPGSIARLVPLLAAALMLVAVSLSVVYFKPAAPVEGLALTCSVDKAMFDFREPITFTTTLENAGDRDVVYYKSDSEIGGVSSLRIHGAGRDWEVYVAPHQTFQSEGPIGSLETLKPRAKVATPIRADAFTKGDRGAPFPLPEGDYTVVATYAKDDNTVPYTIGMFQTERRPVDGLWTGTVSSAPVKFRVGAPRDVIATIEPPENGTQLRISFANAPDAPVLMNGKVKLSVHAKAYGNGSAEFLLSDGKQLAPGEMWVFPVDLANLAWTCTTPKLEGTVGISEFAPNGGWVDVAMETDGPDAKKTITSQGRLVSWTFNTAPPESLALGLRMKSALEATLKLTNTGSATALVNKRLGYASEIAFRLTDPEGAKAAAFSTTGTAKLGLEDFLQRASLDLLGPAIVEGLSWSVDALPKRTPLEKTDFIALEPGASIESGYDLSTLVHGGLPKGSYRLQAVYLNLEPGVRLGLKGVRTGKLTSNAVDVTVR